MKDHSTVQDIQRQQSSHRNQRLQRQCEADDNGDRNVTVPSKTTEKKKLKKELKPPTNAEQAELLQVAIEKGLQSRGFKGLALRQELRAYEHIFSKSRARHLHALNPYAGAKWAGFLQEAIEKTDFDDIPWMVTIISNDWMFTTYPQGPSQCGLRWMLSRMRRDARRGLRGVPYLLQADFAVRRHVADHRTAIEVHWHGLVWATAAQIEALGKRFPADRFEAQRFYGRGVYNLEGALGYVTKDTRVGYSTVQNFGFHAGSRHQKAWFYNREPIWGPKRWMLIGMVGDLTKPELCAASGAGLLVFREAKRLAREGGYGPSPVTARPRTVRRRTRRR